MKKIFKAIWNFISNLVADVVKNDYEDVIKFE